jgi:hypothetical protein
MKLFRVRLTQESLRGVDMQEQGAGDNRMVRQLLYWPMDVAKKEKKEEGKKEGKEELGSLGGRTFGLATGMTEGVGRDVSLQWHAGRASAGGGGG